MAIVERLASLWSGSACGAAVRTKNRPVAMTCDLRSSFEIVERSVKSRALRPRPRSRSSGVRAVPRAPPSGIDARKRSSDV